LKQGKDMDGGMIRMPPRPTKEIMNGVVAPKMGGRGVKGSQEAKDYMKRLRDMRKNKLKY